MPNNAAELASRSPQNHAPKQAATSADDGLAAILAGNNASADDGGDDAAEDSTDDTDDDADPDENPEDISGEPEETDDDADGEEEEETDPTDETDQTDLDEEDQTDETDQTDQTDLDEEDEEDADPTDAEIQAARKKLTPEAQKILDKTVGKIRGKMQAQRAELETATARLAELETENETLRSGQPAPTIATENPLGHLNTEAEITAYLAQQKKARAWALRHPRGGTVQITKDGKPVDQEISEERVAEILAETEEALNDYGPARLKHVQDSAAWRGHVRQAYPFAADKKSPGYVQMQEVLRRYPHLKHYAEAEMMAADMVAGAALRMSRAQAAKKPAIAATPAVKKKSSTAPGKPAATPAGQRPPKVGAKLKTNREAHERFEKTGRDDDGAVLGAILSGG